MILHFSDPHLGIKSYSYQENGGLYTAEKDTRTALEYIYTRAAKPDIDLITCGGDLFHTNQPTTENIRYMIYWIHKMDSLGKPFYIITGNHDTSMYSNSIIFSKELSVKNVVLLCKDSDLYKVHSIKWNGWDIKFIPYIPNIYSKKKDHIVNDYLIETINFSSEKTIIVSHIQESSAKLGSEAQMVSHGVRLIDTDFIEDKKIHLLLGHIHKHQIYYKNKIQVVYPGSTTYMDTNDINSNKGYCIISPDMEVTFEPIEGIRKFNYYYIPKDEDPINYFSNLRILENQVVFIKHNCKKIDRNDIYKFFRDRNSFIGWIRKVDDEEKVQVNLNFKPQSSPLEAVNTFLDYYLELPDQRKSLREDIIKQAQTDLSGAA